MNAAPDLKCRTCGRPRGENIAEGTRCSRCGNRDALALCAAATATAATLAYSASFSMRDAMVAGAAAAVATPAAFVLAVLLHELTHAAAALALGQTLTRVLVGEGVALWRVGRDPQFVLGSVVIGNGRTTITDLRREGYVRRAAINGLSAPAMSGLVGIVFWTVSGEWPLPARTAALIFSFTNLMMAVVTLIPVPTFGGRVWGDLAGVLHLRRLDAAALEEDMVLCARDRLVILFESGLSDEAIGLARTLVERAPGSPLAHSLLAYVLHQTGHAEEAARAASDGLAYASDATSRAYLEQFLSADSSTSANC